MINAAYNNTHVFDSAGEEKMLSAWLLKILDVIVVSGLSPRDKFNFVLPSKLKILDRYSIHKNQFEILKLYISF